MNGNIYTGSLTGLSDNYLLCKIFVFYFLYVRMNRRGKPARILINLCVSLIFLLLVLYLSEVLIRSERGCRAANGLRLYAILVSLSWNGVEALNMYFMLIKVFKYYTSRFVTKAGIICWGKIHLILRSMQQYYFSCTNFYLYHCF